jgi:hypothetical protein
MPTKANLQGGLPAVEQEKNLLNQPATESAAKKGPDPFNLSKLVLNQSFAEAIGAEEVISRIVIRKPNKQEWFRVHPDPEFRRNFGLIELKADNEFYFVHPDLIATLGQWCYPATLYTWVDSTINPLPRLWPVRLPGSDGGDNGYWASARGIADYAMEKWTQMWGDKASGIYRYRGTDKLKDKKPDWRGLTAERVFEIGIKPRLIATLDHPVASKLMHGA